MNNHENNIPTPADVAGMHKATAITEWANQPETQESETFYYAPVKIDRESPAYKDFADAMEILFDHADAKRDEVIEACWGEVGTGLVEDDLNDPIEAFTTSARVAGEKVTSKKWPGKHITHYAGGSK